MRTLKRRKRRAPSRLGAFLNLPIPASLCYAGFVDNPPQRPPLFWPMMFIGAFAFGALLWVIWMAHIVVKTRADRDRMSRDPMYNSQANPAPTNSQIPR